MIVEPDFLDHWKTQMLIRMLNDDCAPLYLIRLWGHCQMRKTHGFTYSSKRFLAAVCKVPKNANFTDEQFHDALIESGYVDIEDDRLIVHEWDSVNASLVASWKNGKKGGRPKKKNPRDNPDQTHGITQINSGLSDREEKRREDREDVVEEGSSSASSSDLLRQLGDFQQVHVECSKVTEMTFAAAVQECVEGDVRPDVDEAIAAFRTDFRDVVTIKPQSPIREFKKYLRHSVKKNAAVVKDKKTAEKKRTRHPALGV